MKPLVLDVRCEQHYQHCLYFCLLLFVLMQQVQLFTSRNLSWLCYISILVRGRCWMMIHGKMCSGRLWWVILYAFFSTTVTQAMPHTNRFQLANQFEFTLFITLTTFIRQMAPCCCVGREPEKTLHYMGTSFLLVSNWLMKAFLKQFQFDLWFKIPELLDSCKKKRGSVQ